MKTIFKSWLSIAAAFCALMCLPQSAAAQAGEEPIIEFKTNVKTSANGESVSILLGGFKSETDYIDIDCGSGTEEHELTPATFDATNESWSGGATVTCTINDAGIVKIYGDASNIAVIDFSGCYIQTLKLAPMPNLYYLNLDHNELEALDVTGFPSLGYLTVGDNPFGKSPLKIGADLKKLQFLSVQQVGKLDPNFKLSNYPKLISFDAYACKDIKSVDLSNCENLQQLSLDGTNVSSVDVSKTPNLTILNISDTNVAEVDLSGLTWLQQLYVDRQGTETKIKNLDVTKNMSLVYLFAAGNDLTSIDLTQNRYLQQLYLADNKLETIDLSKNTQLINVILRNNYFTYATLPAPGAWNQYDYYQRNMPFKKTAQVGEVLDFSAKVLREGTTTTCGVFLVNEDSLEVTPLDESYYKYEDGKVTFLKSTEDSVYVAFANTLFPDLKLDYLPLRTDKFMVKTAAEMGLPDVAFTMTPKTQGADVSMKIGVFGATADKKKKVLVDFGDGVKKEFEVTSQAIPASANISGKSQGTVTVYVEPDDDISSLAIENIKLTDIDVTKLRSLSDLRLDGTGLYAIDLGYNRSLAKLVLRGNSFESLNIRGVNDFYQKNLLTDIDLSNNAMFSVSLNDMGTIRHLNLSCNALTEVSFKDADNMLTLDIHDNRLTSVDVNYCSQMTYFDMSENMVSTLVMPAENSLQTFKCENNCLNFSSLPVLSGVETYTYAPQNAVIIADYAPSIDLESHNVGGKTTYVWKNENDAVLKEGTDYSITKGMTRFLAPIFDQYVYCEMTNPAFPGLTLNTTLVQAADMPKFKIGTFTTTADGTANLVLRSTTPTTICIDWKGGNYAVETYAVTSDICQFTPKTYAGSECTVYAYTADAPLYVFSISDAKLANVDLTNMTQLTLAAVNNAGISEIKLPNSKELMEVKLNGNELTNIDLTKYADQLMLISLNNNKIKSFDATPFKKLALLYMSNGELETIRLDNPNIYDLDLCGNKLQSVDVTKLPSLWQLFLSNNQLQSIDLSKNKDIRVLHIDKNKFRFSTLPLPSLFQAYQYGEQAAIDVVEKDGKIDLSAEQTVGGSPTTFRWFVDAPWYDEDSGELTGEELELGDEYVVRNGVTSFKSPINNIVGAMLNDQFPNLTIYTNPVNISAGDTGVESITENAPSETSIYTINGISLGKDAPKAKGMYIIRKAGKSRVVAQ